MQLFVLDDDDDDEEEEDEIMVTMMIMMMMMKIMIFIDDGVQAMILSQDGEILLSYSHQQGNKLIGAMHWSRHYTSKEISEKLVKELIN